TRGKMDPPPFSAKKSEVMEWFARTRLKPSNRPVPFTAPRSPRATSRGQAGLALLRVLGLASRCSCTVAHEERIGQHRKPQGVPAILLMLHARQVRQHPLGAGVRSRSTMFAPLPAARGNANERPLLLGITNGSGSQLAITPARMTANQTYHVKQEF